MHLRKHTQKKMKHPARPATSFAGPRSPVDRAFAEFRRTQDPEAFAEVVRETRKPLEGTARTLVRDAATADDLVQTTLFAALRGAPSYDPAQPVVPWLIGILMNRARRWRRQDRRVPDPDRMAPELPLPDPCVTVEHRETKTRVADAIRRLPHNYRDVLELHLLRGLTPLEIAGHLGRSRSTVRTQLARGLARLRFELRTAG
ncbi:MAG: sigma-70 family RNA polymerase sigma factor [Planctomycetes bacterium]|nr:sigma-70 family RNA polymerase sigma factor [Planctomycetota bacterium]